MNPEYTTFYMKVLILSFLDKADMYKEMTSLLQQHADMGECLPENLKSQSEVRQISSQLESLQTLQTISPANSPGSATEYLVTQPEDKPIFGEPQCLQALQPLSAASYSGTTVEMLTSQPEANMDSNQLESLQTVQPISPCSSPDSTLDRTSSRQLICKIFLFNT